MSQNNTPDVDDLLDDVLDSYFHEKQQPIEEPVSSKDTISGEQKNKDILSSSIHDSDDSDSSSDSTDAILNEALLSSRSAPATQPSIYGRTPAPANIGPRPTQFGAPRPAGQGHPGPMGPFGPMGGLGGGNPFGAMSELGGLATDLLGIGARNVPMTRAEKIRFGIFMALGLYFGILLSFYQTNIVYVIPQNAILSIPIFLMNLHQSILFGPFLILTCVELFYSYKELIQIIKEYLKIPSGGSNTGLFGLGGILKYTTFITLGLKFIKKVGKDIAGFMVLYILSNRILLPWIPMIVGAFMNSNNYTSEANSDL